MFVCSSYDRPLQYTHSPYTHTRSYTHNNILYVISLHEYISLSVSLLSKSALVPLSFSVREKGFSSMVHHGSYPHSPVRNINLTSKTQGFHDRRDGEGLFKAVANETRYGEGKARFDLQGATLDRVVSKSRAVAQLTQRETFEARTCYPPI